MLVFISFLTLLAAQLMCFAGAAVLETRDLEARQSQSGRMTFYGGNVQGGACSFSTYTLPAGIYGTALSGANWNSAANCGGCIQVHGPNGKTITAMIVDECPECPTNALDLFQNAFSQLADPSVGVLNNVGWTYVPCPTSIGKLQIHMKSGVSQYWFSAQVVNGRRRTDKLEVSVDGGKTWLQTTRQTYNFFEISSGIGATTATIRVTSKTGTTVTVSNVPMQGDAVVTASSNYA
ncbi:carbohydrate-binding module family 63 protein [Myriangium duriaei CBS 260.36]|uniref:Carbohydrate-binding module family 63 protein n=1 Tax=Myriangium duriaei CBS 260.36 TaxID=1168546 RepID=A0A9P4J689_9PEZI|nr:carbohydrate-binding module family 63 protein [Myriangium duriaei CBS 260.36]